MISSGGACTGRGYGTLHAAAPCPTAFRPHPLWRCDKSRADWHSAARKTSPRFFDFLSNRSRTGLNMERRLRPSRPHGTHLQIPPAVSHARGLAYIGPRSRPRLAFSSRQVFVSLPCSFNKLRDLGVMLPADSCPLALKMCPREEGERFPGMMDARKLPALLAQARYKCQPRLHAKASLNHFHRRRSSTCRTDVGVRQGRLAPSPLGRIRV